MKKRWKKVLCFTTAAAMALTAAGCGGGSSEEKKEDTKTTASQDKSQPGQEPGQRGEGAAYSLVAIRNES